MGSTSLICLQDSIANMRSVLHTLWGKEGENLLGTLVPKAQYCCSGLLKNSPNVKPQAPHYEHILVNSLIRLGRCPRAIEHLFKKIIKL